MATTPISPSSLRPAGVPGTARGAHYDVLIVGAGFSGSVMAERAASRGLRVLMVDKREHIAIRVLLSFKRRHIN